MLLDVVACCCAKFETGQTFQQQLPTFFLFRDRKVGSVCTALPTLLAPERRLLTPSHSNLFYKKTICSHCLDLQMENSLLFMWWEFPLDEVLDKIRRGGSCDAIINNF